eukprot:CAMPEP_0202687406 /NCGR_PEP_ID=MMETSP1385-20130828/3089_1 /ASSEMBLY_ACC=CAM_ASM_000861 /TAXON_ID=933848 /ORGANISM="Elphidium margaritaceum" /LENGTH=331 /DNA_ID=CAMNT_0049342189 /DNA_START=86 /DNA_END=1081 /DNA_ORIENTATION=+
MNFKKTVVLLSAHAIGMAYSINDLIASTGMSVCNSVNGLIAVDACIQIDDGGAGEIGSGMFSCGVTGGVLITMYNDNACTDEYMSFDDTSVASFDGVTCDGDDSCPYMSIKNYDSSDCSASGPSITMPVVLGCVDLSGTNMDGYFGYIQCNGADGATAILYDGDDCTGNQVAAVEGSTGCSDYGMYEEFSCSGGTPRDYDPAIVQDGFDDFEATEEVDPVRVRRRRTSRPRRPISTIPGFTASAMFPMEFPGLDKILEAVQKRKNAEFVAQEGVWAHHGTKETVAMMLGVVALVAVMAVYFCRGLKTEKGVSATSETTALLPTTSYGTVNA